MAKYIVFINAGHGGDDPGAVAYGLVEKSLNLTMALACRDELERHGVIVIMSRSKDENDKLVDVVSEANASGAIIALSFHNNAGKGDGWEALINLNNAEAVKIAKLAEKYVKEIGQNSRGLKNGNWLYFVANTDMTALLFEGAFLDNDTDNNIVDTIAKQKAFGVAHAKAVLEYLGITYVSQESVKEEAPKAETPTTDAGELYRVRESWDKPETQKGAYNNLNGAKECADDYPGFSVFNRAGKAVYTSKVNGAFKVRVKITDLNIRTGAGTGYGRIGCIEPGAYTIIETQVANGYTWGLLKGYSKYRNGWIALEYTERI